jgi:glycosyltransferase involved in cell wall biosynthesis
MNISIATGPWFPVPALQGGAMVRVWQGLAETFASKGHTVTIVARAYNGQPQYEIINGVNYIRSGGFSQSRNIFLDLVKDLIYALKTTPLLPQADIIVINDFWLPVLAQWLRPNAGRIVINVNRFPKRQFFLYSGVARLAAASNLIKEAITDQCPSLASKIRVFSNPIDTDVFSPPLARPNKSDKTILYAGRIHPEKGLHILIEAFGLAAKECPRLGLQIVGPVKANQGGGGLTYSRLLRSKAQGLKVEFLDPVFEPTRLAEVYGGADLFCYPSLAEKGEAFPVAPLEAMATGLVPVVSDLKCFRDFIDEGETGYYFDHRGSDAAYRLSQVIRRALVSWELTSQMGMAAVRRAREFSCDRIGNLYLQDFHVLLRSTVAEALAKSGVA